MGRLSGGTAFFIEGGRGRGSERETWNLTTEGRQSRESGEVTKFRDSGIGRERKIKPLNFKWILLFLFVQNNIAQYEILNIFTGIIADRWSFSAG
jgi:hypothetical protein